MQYRFETFTGLINKIAKSIRKIKAEEMSGFGIKSSHVSCLYYLYNQEGSTANKLCVYCDEDKAAISRSLDFLKNNGYVFFEEETRIYNKKIFLTEKGREMGKVIAEKINKVLMQVGAFMSKEERKVFYEILSKISDQLEEITKTYGEK